MIETPLFFDGEHGRLFGVLHEPDPAVRAVGSPPTLGFVFCHPFAEEKLIAHRVLVNLARRLAREGVWCLRFDEIGHGDSEGNFEDATIETRLSDIHSAVELLRARAQVSRLGLLGVRFGATLAALAAARSSGIEALAMVSPIVQGEPYVQQWLRSNLATQLAMYGEVRKDRRQLVEELRTGQTVNVDGYLLTGRLYEQLVELDLLSVPLDGPRSVLAINVSPSEDGRPDAKLSQLCDRYQKVRADVRVVHARDESFWVDQKTYRARAARVEDAVTRWVHEVCGS